MRRLALCVVAAMLFLAGLQLPAHASPTDDPAANTTPSASFTDACAQAITAGCTSSAIVDFDAVRSAEGLAPMTLPTDFDSLSEPLQLLTITDIERVDRGLPPMAGLADSLNSAAQQGADNDEDPSLTHCSCSSYTANWAGGYASPLEADFLWMYDDGPGSPNEDCTTAGDAGCWGHRHDILHAFQNPLVMGAAVNPNGRYGASLATLMVGGDSTDTPDPQLLWSQITPYLPVGVSTASLSLTSGSDQPLTVWASGEDMDVSLSITAGSSAWSVDTASCVLAAGSECSPTVAYAPTAGTTDGTLTVTGPNGSQQVTLHAVSPPSAPTGVSAVAGNADATVSWTPTADQGSSPVTSYVATAEPGGAACMSAANSCVIGGLTNGVAYAISVVASNIVGPSAASASATVTPIAPPAAVAAMRPGVSPSNPQPPGCTLTHASFRPTVQKVTLTCHGYGDVKGVILLQKQVRGRWVTVHLTTVRLGRSDVVTTHLSLAHGVKARVMAELGRRQLAVAAGRIS